MISSEVRFDHSAEKNNFMNQVCSKLQFIGAVGILLAFANGIIRIQLHSILVEHLDQNLNYEFFKSKVKPVFRDVDNLETGKECAGRGLYYERRDRLRQSSE